MEQSRIQPEGLDASWFIVTGKLIPEVHVLEDVLSDDVLEEINDDAAITPIPKPVVAWFKGVAARLAEMPEMTSLPLNPALTNLEREPVIAALEIYLCSRRAMDQLLDAEGALGLHIISTPDLDIFDEESAYARSHRIAMVYDEGELLDCIRNEARQDSNPEYHLDEYLEAWLNTLFHEIEHVRLFAQNAALNTPDAVEALYEAGDLDHDLFDCSSGYGIRPLMSEGFEAQWSDTMEQAQDDMEDHVERRGRDLMRRTLRAGFSASDFLTATGLSDKVSDIILRGGLTDEPGQINP